MCEQPALHREMESAGAVSEAPDAACRKHAVARYHQREAVLPAGLPHGARGRAELARDAAVAARPPRPDGGDLRPHAALERRSQGAKRHIEAEFRVVEVTLDLAANALAKAVLGRKRLARLRQEHDLGQEAAFGADSKERKRRRQLRLVDSARGSHGRHRDMIDQALAAAVSRRRNCIARTSATRAMPTASASALG